MSGIEPKLGVVTFQSEGAEGGPYHSRKLHVPTDSSGLTIGRGYDLRFKSKQEILIDLTKIGLDKNNVEIISSASGLYGEAARKIINNDSLKSFEVSPLQQLKLFEISYEREAAETKRLCTNLMFKDLMVSAAGKN